MRGILAICLILLSSVVSHAKDSIFESIPDKKDTSITENFAIYYRFDRTEFDQTYMSNSETAAHIKNYLINSPRIDSITIYAWASPEGAYLHNVKLSQRRAKTAKQFLLSHSPDSSKLNADKIKISPLAENWQGLEAMVVEKYRRHDREKVLDILRDRTIGDETRKWRLQQLDGGHTWKYMIRNYMPQLRAATWICVWAEVIDPLPAVVAMTVEAAATKEAAPVRETSPVVPTKERKAMVALKTNMLMGAVTALNYGVEIPIGQDFSLQFQQYTPWWVTRSNRHCLQFLSLGTEFRWWFKSDEVLQGHFIGANVWSGTGDLQWKKAACYQFDFWSAGLTYGYAMPIARWANLEFSVSAGYASIPYQHYIPTDDYEYLIIDRNDVGRMHYFGPTKAEISLVIPIRYKTQFKRTAR